jgi:hypothetical protein
MMSESFRMLTSVNSTDAARCPLSPCNDLIDINATYRAPIDWREGRGARPTGHDLTDLLGQVCMSRWPLVWSWICCWKTMGHPW